MKPFCGGNGIVLETKAVTPLDCLHYALNLPTSVVITRIDNQKVLDQAFEATKTFQPMSEQQVASLLSKTTEVAAAGKYELFKTSTHFDSTIKHPDWLGDASPAVQKIVGGATIKYQLLWLSMCSRSTAEKSFFCSMASTMSCSLSS
jgi:uncharacterized protein